MHYLYKFIVFLYLQINEFVKLGGDQLVPYYADILGAILPSIADKEEKIRVVGSVFLLYFAPCATYTVHFNFFFFLDKKYHALSLILYFKLLCLIHDQLCFLYHMDGFHYL